MGRLRVTVQEHRAPGGEAAAADDGGARARHLAIASLAAQLHDGLVHQPHAVRAPCGKLAAVRVGGDHAAVAGDVLTAVEEVLRLADPAEAERLEPGHAVESEAVVQPGDLDVRGPQARPGPQGASGAP